MTQLQHGFPKEFSDRRLPRSAGMPCVGVYRVRGTHSRMRTARGGTAWGSTGVAFSSGADGTSIAARQMAT